MRRGGQKCLQYSIMKKEKHVGELKRVCDCEGNCERNIEKIERKIERDKEREEKKI